MLYVVILSFSLATAPAVASWALRSRLRWLRRRLLSFSYSVRDLVAWTNPLMSKWFPELWTAGAITALISTPLLLISLLFFKTNLPDEQLAVIFIGTILGVMIAFPINLEIVRREMEMRRGDS